MGRGAQHRRAEADAQPAAASVCGADRSLHRFRYDSVEEIGARDYLREIQGRPAVRPLSDREHVLGRRNRRRPRYRVAHDSGVNVALAVIDPRSEISVRPGLRHYVHQAFVHLAGRQLPVTRSNASSATGSRTSCRTAFPDRETRSILFGRSCSARRRRWLHEDVRNVTVVSTMDYETPRSFSEGVADGVAWYEVEAPHRTIFQHRTRTFSVRCSTPFCEKSSGRRRDERDVDVWRLSADGPVRSDARQVPRWRPRGVELAYGPYGKPSSSRRRLEFSLAHSGGVGAWRSRVDRDVGVDVERVDGAARRPDRGSAVLPVDEAAELRSLPEQGEVGASSSCGRRRRRTPRRSARGVGRCASSRLAAVARRTFELGPASPARCACEAAGPAFRLHG